ncbi:MAG: ATP synthase F0 subunit B [Acidobacteria bacterium]|nr:ATP synthase F0 subunit B [Acidobacteriota bacterium]
MRKALAGTVVFGLMAAPAWAGEGSTLGIPDPLWKLVNLLAFLAVLVWFVGRPLGRFLDARRRNIGQQFEDARDKLRRAEELRAEVETRLANVKKELEELRARAEREAKAEVTRIEAEAKAEEERFFGRVEEEITRRTAEVRRRLAEDTAALTAQMARELLSREITDADRARLLERSLAALGSLEKKG